MVCILQRIPVIVTFDELVINGIVMLQQVFVVEELYAPSVRNVSFILFHVDEFGSFDNLAILFGVVDIPDFIFCIWIRLVDRNGIFLKQPWQG